MRPRQLNLPKHNLRLAISCSIATENDVTFAYAKARVQVNIFKAEQMQFEQALALLHHDDMQTAGQGQI